MLSSALRKNGSKEINQAVRRNALRFPNDFYFEITKQEYAALRSQIVTLENGRGRYTKYLPFFVVYS